MRRFTLLGAAGLAAAGLVAIGVVGGCGERHPTRTESAQATGEHHRDQVQQELEQRLGDLKGRIQAIQSRAKEGNPGAQEALQDARDTLAQQQAKADQALAALKDASADAWKQARTRASAALDALERTVDQVASKLS